MKSESEKQMKRLFQNDDIGVPPILYWLAGFFYVFSSHRICYPTCCLHTGMESLIVLFGLNVLGLFYE